MSSNKIWDNLWKYILPIIAVILWVVTIILFFRSKSGYDSSDYETQQRIINALRWYPACCIGAIISTAAGYVISEFHRHCT